MLNLYVRAAALATGRTAVTDQRDRGATAVEYALIIAGVAAVLAVVVFALQDVLTAMFQDTCQDIAQGADGVAVPDECTTP